MDLVIRVMFLSLKKIMNICCLCTNLRIKNVTLLLKNLQIRI